MWHDHVHEAREALDRTAIMLRAQLDEHCQKAAAFIVSELRKEPNG